MRTPIGRSLLVLLALLLPGLVSAQGIGDAAAREKQKRQTTPKTKTTRVITNDDLEEGRRRTSPSPRRADGASPALESTPSATCNYQAERESRSGAASEGDSRQQAIDQAQAQVDSARSAVVAAEARVKELGDKLNPMSTSFVYGAAQTGDAAGEEMRTREALRGAEAGARRSPRDARAGQQEPRGRATGAPALVRALRIPGPPWPTS